MAKHLLFGLTASVLVWALPAIAGDQPLYQAEPTWVAQQPLPPVLISGTGVPGPSMNLQQRFENGVVWTYMDVAFRVNSPEDLARGSVITLPWAPDKGDLIIHELKIIRGTQTIDLIEKGQRFTVLRREEALEQRQLTGVLTATLAVEGLQVGDVLRLRASTTNKDPVLGGRVQGITPLLAMPVKFSGVSLRMSWPESVPLKWKIQGQSIVSQQTRDGKFVVLTVSLPAPKQVEMPEDAPARYRHPPLVAVSSFADWRDVSQVMAPLYETANTIPAGSPLAAEVDRIMRAEQDPVRRTALALRSVQDNIRYLAVGMDGGNYVPQSPEKTWSVRYGDCKAKTLLLLAMLHRMNIAAEPVLASIAADDLVPENVASAAAFDHVFVKATIDGKSYWLDGTRSGTRLADIGDTPPLRNVLPLRRNGADLELIRWQAPAQPTLALELDIDESTSVDLPSVIDAKLTFRGDMAVLLTQMAGAASAKEKQDILDRLLIAQFGEGQVDGATMAIDAEAGTVVIKGRIIVATPWKLVDRRHTRKLTVAADRISFNPDRSRAAWVAVPVSTGAPDHFTYKATIRLPERGRGFVLEDNAGTGTVTVAGYTIDRKIGLVNGVLTVEETVADDGREIPAASIPQERGNMAKMQAKAPRLTAPIDAKRRWQLSASDLGSSSQGKAIEGVYANAVAGAEADDTSALGSRFSYRNGTGNHKGALSDLGLIIAKEPSVENYVRRGAYSLDLGDTAAALADGEAALKLDPNSVDAIALVASAEAERGNLNRAVELLDEQIALGGEKRSALIETKADLIGQFGDPQVAIALLDGLLAETPGNPRVLNAMCWIRGTRAIELDVALKNCTSAIELSANSAPILDSRAMVWYRLGRYEDALRDLDAALLQVPSLGPTRFMRALVLHKLGRKEEAQRELALARRLSPSVDKTYARYGLKADF